MCLSVLFLNRMVDLKGKWTIEYLNGSGEKVKGSMHLPGIMQAAGFGEPVTATTEFVSSLHDPDWYLRDEYAFEDISDPTVPFLSKPRRHFVGVCRYTREFELEDGKEPLFLFLEITRRKSSVYIDGRYAGESESYCGPHIVPLGILELGLHNIDIDIDNSVYPGFRPDAHTVTDSVGASWNGMAGRIEIVTESELSARYEGFKAYAMANPRSISVIDGNFSIDGNFEYIRGTHFGGDFPLNGTPVTDKEYYLEIFERLFEWGFNLVRCHSFCPVEAMFEAADECGMYILVECGMWSYFGEGLPIMDFLYRETELILKEFGHHPSFVMLSPSNEPFGNWYGVLRKWVSFARECDRKLGYEGRRLYTAQSGWFYDTAPSETEGTDFLYFHRSAYGPLKGGTVRNVAGWHGKDYSCSLEGVKIPVICHELGQWCAYPGFDVIDKFTGYLKPSNFIAFKNLAKRNGLLPFAEEMHMASGRNQLRLLKEEFEANHRTPELKGYEYLDVHDYIGQGTALVGIFDAFFDPKAYADREYFTQFNSADVLTAAFADYTVKQGDTVSIPVMLSHYSDDLKEETLLKAELLYEDITLWESEYRFTTPARGSKTKLADIELMIPELEGTKRLVFRLSLDSGYSNSWDLFAVKEESAVTGGFSECRDFSDALRLLDEGKDVLFLPHLSELDYDCTPCNERSIYWNGQMGPRWERNTGILVDDKSPFFDLFPSDASGGFQWGPILRAGRSFVIPGGFKPLVRVIDDWNRSIPQAFLLEAKVLKGRVLMAAFDREMSDDPACRLFYSALTGYIVSEDFRPEQELDKADLIAMYHPVNRMKELVSSVSLLRGSECLNPEGMVLSNPNIVTQATGVCIKEPDHSDEVGIYETAFEIRLKKPVEIKGFVWLNDQRKRIRDDYAKSITVSFGSEDDPVKETVSHSFSLKNTSREQRLMLSEAVVSDNVVLRVRETWGREEKPMWVETSTGFEKQIVKKSHKVGIAAFHLICDEPVQGDDIRFWEKNDEVLTKEIDT